MTLVTAGIIALILSYKSRANRYISKEKQKQDKLPETKTPLNERRFCFQ